MNAGMLKMIRDFNAEKDKDEPSLESTELYRFYLSAADKYAKYNRVSDIFRNRKIGKIVEEIRSMLSNERFKYGLSRADEYRRLDSAFWDRYKNSLSGRSYKERVRSDHLMTIIRKGHPNITDKQLYSFLTDNREQFRQACLSAAVIYQSCDACAHEERFTNDRIGRYVQNCDIVSAGEPDEKSAGLLMDRLRKADADMSSDPLLIGLDTSRHSLTSLVIVNNAYLDCDPKDGTKDTGVLRDPKQIYHFAIFDPSNAYPNKPLINAFSNFGSDISDIWKKFSSLKRDNEQILQMDTDILQVIDKTDLGCFEGLFAKGNEDKTGISAKERSKYVNTSVDRSGAPFAPIT